MSEEFDDWYRKTSAADPERPSEAARQTILAFARESAANRAYGNARARRRRSTVFGALAAAMLAGLVVLPLWLSPPRHELLRPSSVTEMATSANSIGAPAPKQPPVPAPSRSSSPRVEPALPQRPTLDAPSDNLRRSMQASASSRSADAVMKAQAENSVAAAATAGQAGQAGQQDALRQAARRGDLVQLRSLLDAGVDPESRDADGRTALMWAVIGNHGDAVDLLLARGADPDAADARGVSPTNAARHAGHEAILRRLNRVGESGTR